MHNLLYFCTILKQLLFIFVPRHRCSSRMPFHTFQFYTAVAYYIYSLYQNLNTADIFCIFLWIIHYCNVSILNVYILIVYMVKHIEISQGINVCVSTKIY